MTRFARLVLLAYPKSFRREFGAEWLRTVDDMRRHGDRRAVSVAIRVLTDAALTAPSLRWESSMPALKTTLVLVVAVLLGFGLVVGAPLVVIPVVIVGGALLTRARRHDRPIAVEAAEMGRHWYVWIAAAAVCGVLGLVMLGTDGEAGMPGWAWLTWMLSWLTGIILVLVGAVLGATRLVHQRRV